MASLLTPRLLRRGFQLFLLATLIGFGAVLLYGNDTDSLLAAIPGIRWGWLAVGVGLAAMDWVGGGLRLWVLAREVHARPPLPGLIVAGGMGAWASYVTPLQSGAAPMMVYAMRRAGVPVPVGLTTVLMSFIATVAFFAIAGPVAIAFGAGKSLGQHGIVLGISLYDLFLGSLGIFIGLFVLLLGVVVFPRFAHRALHAACAAVGRRSRRVTARLKALQDGIDQTHDAVVAFNTPRGWLALLWATLISGPSHANKLLSGYVVLRALGIDAHFVDVLLLQTLITSLLYFFAPTPGGSGVGEVLSAAVMSIYVPRALTPLYTLLWRLVVSWYTIAAGAVVFGTWVRRGLKGIEAVSLPTGLAGPTFLTDNATRKDAPLDAA